MVQPQLVIALGATAAYAMTGNGKEVTRRQGQIEQSNLGVPVLITGHPAAILRAPDKDLAQTLRGNLTSAFRMAEGWLTADKLADTPKPQLPADLFGRGTINPG